MRTGSTEDERFVAKGSADGQVAGLVRVGTSGWSYEDWAGRFYPQKRPRGFDELAYLARFFDCVEVNSSFYRPPSPRAATSWLQRTPEDFEFTFKLYQRFTHERDRPWSADEVAEYQRGIEPILEAGRLARCSSSSLGLFRPTRMRFGTWRPSKATSASCRSWSRCGTSPGWPRRR